MKSYIIDIYGRVQGMGLRMTIRRYAIHHKLNGYVVNLKSGVARVHLSVNEEELREFVSWIKSSPGLSKVESVFIRESNEKISEGFFIIRNKNLINDQICNFKSLLSNSFSRKGQLPRHVVVIPDGNRRWAKRRGLKPTIGHEVAASYNHIRSLLDEADDLGLEYLSFWGFSTENWKRSKEEVSKLFQLLSKNMKVLRKYIIDKSIVFKHIGRRDRLPKDLLKDLSELERASKNNHGMHLQFLLDYGGRDELIGAVNKIIKKRIRKVDERDFKNYLYTHDMPDPDLVIRTSGEQRTSGLMPFQTTYSEYYFMDKTFPSFGKRDLRKAVYTFMKRKRRFGGN